MKISPQKTTQLNLFYPPVVDLDGRRDCDDQVTYMGKAVYVGDEGLYRCLAQVNGTIAVVETRLRF